MTSDMPGPKATDTPSAISRRLPSIVRYCRRSPHSTKQHGEPPFLRYSPISLDRSPSWFNATKAAYDLKADYRSSRW
jgi:hypothetical protein